MTAATVGRQRMIDALAEALEPVPFVRAAWLGGSDASGRTDEWSDIDLQLVANDDAIEPAIDAVHGALLELSPTAQSYRLPKPTWHGHEQEFLSLRDAEPFHFVDLVVLARSSTDWFLEPERHGNPLVLFDKDGLVRPALLDREKHAQKMAARLEVLRSTFPLFQNLVSKAVLRRDGPDAMQAYMAYTIRPLVEVLRMRYCPLLYDYGLRYLDRDLPEPPREEIAELVFPQSTDAVEPFRARAEALFRETMRAFDEGT